MYINEWYNTKYDSYNSLSIVVKDYILLKFIIENGH